MVDLLRKVVRRLRNRDARAARAAKAAKAAAKAATARASSQLEAGAWGAACESYREALRVNGGKKTSRYALAKALQRRYLVPFEVDGDTVVPIPAEAAEAAFTEALFELQAVVDTDPKRVRATYFLGRHFEHGGRYVEAAQTYQLALTRLETVDEPWGHSSRLAWMFRRDWVAQLLNADPDADPRLLRSTEAAEALPGGPSPDVAGFIDATVTHKGLAVTGFVLADRGDDIDIHLDGRFLVRVTADPGKRLHNFGITLTHRVLDEFPSRARLTAFTDTAGLVSKGGAEAIIVDVPDGSGKLPVLLDDGYRVNKKGRLSEPGAEAADHGPRYFRAYRRVHAVFAEKLGKPLFLVYGTLLGCYRDGALIPGDDDFDVAYLCAATDPKGVKDETMDVMAALIAAGFDVRIAIDGRPFHLGVDGVGIDVNPLWQYQERVFGFTGHALAREDLAAVTPLDVGEVTVDVPRGAEAFLRDTYGPDWRTPAPGFRYYRSDADLKELRKARLTPSEVRRFAERVEELRRDNPGAGRFLGYAVPDNPDFE
ncbi:LicD family protein [Stackebrandtia nassauensis]|uniref:LicD family protein n=1 Tax=Stackebrandtia nassauensis (strain DSM 44728 / CIP 108903 / NRRL B-16338 / NBRC 102104 / LLR-40K-21) TaxID=446470 RepID=D3Q7V3_STANL|nr:LicD family protein [Stackebrandtia nassauensis]ADD40458.1 LicD family protein [Stackebrandtia nassauensis DSM 44728]